MAYLAAGRWRSWVTTSPWQPPRLWLDILFSGVPFPPRCGLYQLRTPTQYWSAQSSIYVRPVFGTRSFSDSPGMLIISPMSERVLVGIEVSLFGFQFLLCMVPIHTGFLPREALYRPRLHSRFALQARRGSQRFTSAGTNIRRHSPGELIQVSEPIGTLHRQTHLPCSELKLRLDQGNARSHADRVFTNTDSLA